MAGRWAVLVFGLVFCSLSALGAEFWVLGAVVATPLTDCPRLEWQADLTIHNPEQASGTVRVLGVSNGTLQEGTRRSFDVAPNETVSLRRIAPGWSPGGRMGMLHLDAPATFALESRLDISSPACLPPYSTFPPLPFRPDRGKVALPIFRELVPPSVRQTHLGTDVGTHPARTNVGVFNAGAAAANAVVELRRACDGVVVARREFSVPPNTLLHERLSDEQTPCLLGERVQPWVYLATVTVDQPSLSFVSAIANDVEPQVSVATTGAQ